MDPFQKLIRSSEIPIEPSISNMTAFQSTLVIVPISFVDSHLGKWPFMARRQKKYILEEYSSHIYVGHM